MLRHIKTLRFAVLYIRILVHVHCVHAKTIVLHPDDILSTVKVLFNNTYKPDAQMTKI